MKHIGLTIVCLLLLHYAEARKRSCRPGKHLIMQEVTWSQVQGARPVGRIYTFRFQSRAQGVLPDSVWFGAHPVPADLWEAASMNPCHETKKKGQYVLRANRDLYELHASQYDAAKASVALKTCVPFQGEALVFYRYRGRRYYQVVHTLREVPSDKYRK